MKQFGLKLLLYSGVLLVFSSAMADVNGDDIQLEEQIIDVEEINQHPFVYQFLNLQANIVFEGKNLNANPLPYLKNSMDYHPLLQGQRKPVQSIYVAKRVVNTSIPIDLFEKAEFVDASIQPKLFKAVNFRNCNTERCDADQMTALGRAKYNVAYKFLKGSDLINVAAPLDQEHSVGVRYALIQNAYNWNDFFTSGFNLILIRDVNHQAQLVSFQVFFLGDHILPDTAYRIKISHDLNEQVKSFVGALSKP